MLFLFKPLLSAFLRRSATATVRNMSSSAASAAHERMFQINFDPLSGKSEWVVIVEDEEDDGMPTNSKALLATTSYLDMLNDTRRNRAFRQAIEKTVTKPCHVLDIGAGTGLLSLIAARAMGLAITKASSGSDGMVTACESYLPMVKLMRKVLRANRMDGKIRIINKRSDELEIGRDIGSHAADVLVSEILDSELLGEGLIPTLQHAHDNLLVENPLTVPYRATIYGQLVECTYFSELHNILSKDAKASDGIRLIPSGTTDLCVKQEQFAMHCDAIKEECKLLSEPFKVFDFDFWRRPDSYRETELHLKATDDGTVHAIVSWWLLQLDSEGTIFYSTGPKWIRCPNEKESISSFHASEDWCDHWKQSVWFTPNSGLSVLKNEEVQLHAVHTETSIAYDFNSSHSKKEIRSHGLSIRNDQIILSPERNALYGDHGWRYLMLNAIQDALHQRESPLCVVADDSIFVTVAIANLCKSSHVIPFFPGLGKKGLQYLEKAAAANGYSMDQIEILKKRDLQLTLDSQQRKINLFVAEPFYYGHDSVLPWQNLRFWKDRTALQSILSKDMQIVPCRGLLKTCAVYLPDLWQSRRCLTDIEGFDHSMVNTTLGACGDLPITEDSPFLPFFLWQCGETKILSEITTILEFDFSKPMSSCSGKAEVQFRESGTCHGFVIWIDWVLKEDGDDNAILSTGPDKRYWKQAVKLLRKPVKIKHDADFYSTEFEAFFDSSTGDLVINHGFS